jgi:C4-dicarboxylate transporter, DctM subunit
MDNVVYGWLGLVILFAILALGIPIGIAMGIVGFVGFGLITGWTGALSQLGISPFTNVASYTLTVIPLFILMGELAFHSGLIRGAYFAANKFIGHFPWGLAMATVFGCAAFSAICGSSIATASTMTSVAYPEMKRFKYDDRLSLGSIAAAGTLGILIPPSNAMVIYAIFAEVSIGKLFMGGVIPGIILTLFFMLGIGIWTKMDPNLAPSSPNSSWTEKLKSLLGIWPVVVLAAIVLGGIWLGVFSATEAAGLGAFGALVIGLLSRTLNLMNIYKSLYATVKTSAMIFIIIIGAMIFNYFIVITGVPNQLAGFVQGLAIPAVGVLIAILLVYLVLGCLMDTMAMTVLTLPIFLPILSNLGYDYIWFGIIFVVMCEFALITPPVGMNVFIVSGMVRDVPMFTIFKGLTPFLISLTLLIIILIVFPQTALFIPQSMSK